MKLGIAARTVLALLVAFNPSARVAAQTTLSNWEKQLEPIQTSNQVTPYTFNSFGENTNLQDGSTSFSWTDIDIKGNNALPVRFQRSLSIENTYHGGGDIAPTLAEFGTTLGAVSINLDIPRLKGTYASDGWIVDTANPNARCTYGASAPPSYSEGIFQSWDYWNGNWMHIPWEGDQEMLRSPASSIQKSGSAPLMTRNMWAFQCLPVTKNGYPGEGFIAISPAGEKYYFDWGVSYPGKEFKKRYGNYAHTTATLPGVDVYFFVTRIEDRFGNWVAYTYDRSTNKLTGIDSSDGRYIHITGRVNGAISTVESSVGTWHYSSENSDYSHGLVVTLPDDSTESYLGTGKLDIEPSDDPPYVDEQPTCAPPSLPVGQFEFSIVLPSGAMADYQFDAERHWTTNVQKLCNAFLNEQGFSIQFLTIPNFHDSFTLTSKTVSGPGLPISQWTYSYPTNGVPDVQGFRDVCDNPPGPNACPATSTTIVEGPDRSYKVYKFGQKYQVNSGQLLSLEEGYETGTAPNITRVPLRTTQNTYVSDAEAATAQFPSSAGNPSWASVDTAARSLLRPLKATTIAQDGVTFSWQVASNCNGNNTLCFNKRANPLTVVKSNTLGYTRTEATTYAAEITTKWILGLVAQVKCVAPTTALPAGCGSSGTVMSETTYDTTYGTPQISKAFGKVQQTLGYDTTSTVASNQLGTLKSVKDGNNNVTKLTNWKRGIPQTITYPATTDQPTPVNVSASVNDGGWITSVVDENGYSTGYGYDPMGRLASIVYPKQDSTTWNPTTITYLSVSSSEYGIPGGHWKRTESTGNSRKVTYYDSLLRPLVEEQYDNTSSTTIADTRSVTVKRYDTSGRLAFRAYPMSSLTNYASTSLKGTGTYYDALDRVTSVQQDSELGLLTTSTAYLAGFKTQVTNPRAFNTITSYMAFDQPTMDWPVNIQAADGRPVEEVTDITRDIFGKPTSIKRHDPGNAISETRSYVYDGNQLLCKTIEPETGATLVNYDAANNVDWSASGQSLTTPACDRASVAETEKVKRVYDARNRLKTLRLPDGRGDQDLSYYPDNLPAQITTYNDAGQASPFIDSYHYNKRRMLDGTGESLQWPGWYTWSIGHGYDANGHLMIQHYPSGQDVNYAPNALGQPTQASTFATGVKYWPNGAIKHFVYGNGIVHDMTQNDRQLPETSKDAYGNAKTIYDSYVYDEDGNVDSILDGTTGRGERHMEYDALDRLMDASSAMFGTASAGMGTVDFTYDALDNLTNLNMPATDTAQARNQFYCYDTHKRLTSLRDADGCAGNSLVNLTYDVRGNLKTKGSQSYTFGFNNRLYETPGKEQYRYDANGNRGWQNSTAGYILSLYAQDGQLMHRTDTRAGYSIDYISLGGSLVASWKKKLSDNSITVEYQHTDALGTPVAVTNASRTVIERSEYEPYGQLLNRPQHDGPGFTGHVQDATSGLTYMQQRYYDPMIGRFLSVDPVTATGVGGNFNRYWYANDNPYRFVDLDGRCTGSMFSNSDGTCLGSGGFTTQSFVRSSGPIGDLEGGGSGASNNQASSSSETPWVDSAASQLGQKETPGEGANEQIIDYLATTTYPSRSDETAWCSAFVNWSFSKVGIEGTNSVSALSWSNWGQRLSQPAYGSVAVIDWGRGHGHVGFVVGISPTGRLILLGGNQSNSVKISSLSQSLVKAYVYPSGLTPSYVLPVVNGNDSSGYSNTR